MNTKETFFFIAKCLTINNSLINKEELLCILKKHKINWDLVVKISTINYVLPSVYCNLKRAKFLNYLPRDLVKYMKYITDLNRERNRNIIKEARALNEFLLKNNIKPIFIKGTAYLLDNLYDDIAERMIGDIDILISHKDFQKAIKILDKFNYKKNKNSQEYFPGFRHYPRLIKKNKIAALEIHSDLIKEKYREELNQNFIFKNIKNTENFYLLNYKLSLITSIISSQINDYGYELYKFPLRNAYDVLLISQKVDTKNSILNFKLIKDPLNFFLVKCAYVFADIDTIKYIKTIQSRSHLRNFKIFNFNIFFRSIIYIKYLKISFNRRILIFCKAFYDRKTRIWLIKKIKSLLFFQNNSK